jgi:hypothetical protein
MQQKPRNLQEPSKDLYKEGDTVEITDDQPLEGKDVAPPVQVGKQYPVKGIILDRDGFQHLDLGLESKYSYVSSFETEEKLRDGHKIHWVSTRRTKKVA